MSTRVGPVSRRFVACATETCLCLLLVALSVWLKLGYDPPLGEGLDGSYYLQIARHVAAGHGFVTSVSAFHMGLEPLPQPAMTYPLWPLLLGVTMRVAGASLAAKWLPLGLYWLSLALCYLWVRGAVRRSVPTKSFLAPVIAAGVSAWLAVNPVYHWASSRPYTEALALTLLFGLLHGYAWARAHRLAGARETLVFTALGLTAGLCYLARFQLLVAGVVLVAVELAGVGARRFRRAGFLLAGMLLPVLGWAAHVLSLPNAELRVLFDYAAYRQLGSVPPFVYTVPCGSAAACALDKLAGVVEAFSPRSTESYVSQFGVVVFVLPVAVGLVAFLRRPRRALRRSLGRGRHASLWASAGIGLLAVAPIHLVHSAHWHAWGFGWRQGLPLVFALVPILVVLLTRGVRVALPVAVLLLVALVTLGKQSFALAEKEPTHSDLEPVRAVAAYLDREARGRRTLGIEPQPIGAFTDAPLDWVACWSDPALAEVLVRERGVSRAVLRGGEHGCRGLDRIRSRLTLEARVGRWNEYAVFVIDRPPPR